MYDIDFNVLGTQQLPVGKRKPIWKSIVFSLLFPLQNLNTVFVSFRAKKNYELQFSAQVIYLEHFLNDKYDPTARGIYIEDTANIEYTYLHNKIEEVSPIYLHNTTEDEPIYLFGFSEYESVLDFIVNVPTGVDFNELLMRNQILKYNLAGKRFTINTY